ncbi:MAG: HypC/HybG/HupF family hydrogenase formation chaperone [Candidatus Altiarchaeota archaeon]
MCYAIPGKIIKIDGKSAKIDYEGVTKSANIQLIDGAKIGDYVLVHAGFAIEKLDQKSAEETLEIVRKFVFEAEKKQ